MWQRQEKKMDAEETCSIEIPVGEEERGHQGPEEEAQAQPAGAHLHPHSRHAALHGLGAGVRSEAGQGGKGERHARAWIHMLKCTYRHYRNGVEAATLLSSSN